MYVFLRLRRAECVIGNKDDEEEMERLEWLSLESFVLLNIDIKDLFDSKDISKSFPSPSPYFLFKPAFNEIFFEHFDPSRDSIINSSNGYDY